jgi:hypothetical protein
MKIKQILKHHSMVFGSPQEPNIENLATFISFLS